MKLTITIRHQLSLQDISNIIIYILYERSAFKRVTKNVITRTLKLYLSIYGTEHLQNTISTFSQYKNFEEKKKKADCLSRKIFPELFNDELNSINYIKSLEV